MTPLLLLSDTNIHIGINNCVKIFILLVMTWNPLKRNYLTQRPTSAAPLLSHTEEKELDLVVQRLIYIENAIRKLTKEMKKYIAALVNLDKADQRLSINLTSCGLVQNNSEYRQIVEEYFSVAAQVGKKIQDVTNLCHKTFIEPLKKLRNEFVTIAAAITKREDLVATWKYSYNRVKKLQEKKDRTASHIAKLEKERRIEETAAKDLKTIHTQLLTELPVFLERRVEYINPCIHAVIMIQLNYYGCVTQLYTQLMPMQYLELTSNIIVSEEEYQCIVKTELNKLRALTIVKE
ncbi:bridging integrator 3 homolog isoform X2 [Harpegnathos saltator]|uniref:bridging integrator 3 homolog isoform X2 n=2 Tax=Harpegnathos saltator TaxID=610380 RepID=UPI00059118D2|nr:bridging integrator 3 homolog isoform X2 [Harpegnathos saltator]